MSASTAPESFVPEAVTHLTTPSLAALPRRVLYATSAALGGTGLDSTSLEGVSAAYSAGLLQLALCFGCNRGYLPARSLLHHPVHLLSWLESEEYYAVKKRYTSWMSGREMRRGNYDFFHGWSGDAFHGLMEARLCGAPSVIDIPTWHRNKGVSKPSETKSEREKRLTGRTWKEWRKGLPIDRVRAMTEYDLADIILVPSRKAAETFLAAGLPPEKLQYVGRGVDAERYSPGTQQQGLFRLIFVGALIKRKGVHHLLEAWKKLALKDAELVLVGTLHDEMKPALSQNGISSVRHVGFSSSVQTELQRSSAFVFPSECEGFAKVTLEAAACGLPLITTEESGDALVDGVNGVVIPPNDPNALAAAILNLYQRQDELPAMGLRGRERVLSCLTWDHYRQRILHGYSRAMATKNP